jgi:pimeloyl-ACP methyl ester carboxylesterase
LYRFFWNIDDTHYFRPRLLKKNLHQELHFEDYFTKIRNINLKVRSITNPTLTPEQPTLVFLHDSLGCIKLWRDFPEIICKDNGVNGLIYDRQGYGESAPFALHPRKNNYLEIEAHILAELIRKLNIQKCILFGHSDGGSISLVAAAEYPELICGVITEGAHVFVEEITLRGILNAVELYKTTNLKERLEKYHGKKTYSVFNAWCETWLSSEFRTWNIERYLPHIKAPLLALQGVDDEYGSLDQLKAIVNKSSGKSTMEVIPDAAHTPHKENRETVLKLTKEFISYILNNEL